MRGLKSTILSIVVLGGLGAYIYFVDAKRPGGVPGPAGTIVESKEKVFPVEADKIEEVRVTAEKETTVLRKQDGTWKMIEPAAIDADQTEASGLANALTGLEYGRIVEENTSDLANYGLAEPKFRLAFKGAANAAGEILIGERTATGSDLFAVKAGEKRVFLIPSYHETSFNKKPFDLRDKRVLNVKRDEIDALEITGGADVQLTRKGTDWSVTRPVQARADYSAVEGLLTRITGANMTKLVEQVPSGTLPADALAKYGLDKPALTITIGAGSSKASLAIGKEEDGTLYARDLARPMVFGVDTTLAADLKKPADDYRNKNIFEFRSFNLARLRIARGTDTYEFVKVPAKAATETDKWQRTTNGGAATDVETEKMEDLLSKLTNLRAESFVASGPPQTEVTVSTSHDEGKFERVRFGKSAADVVATREGEPGAAKLSADNYAETIKSLDAVLAAAPAKTGTQP
jgi:hypothetical protein